MDRRMVGFIALLAYVAIYPIFNQYSWLDFLKLGEPWNGLIETYSQRPVRFVLWIFLIVHFIPERAIEWLRTRPLYKRILSSLKLTLLPFGFAVLILYGAFAISNHLLFNIFSRSTYCWVGDHKGTKLLTSLCHSAA